MPIEWKCDPVEGNQGHMCQIEVLRAIAEQLDRLNDKLDSITWAETKNCKGSLNVEGGIR
jgi:hypothetical protein